MPFTFHETPEFKAQYSTLEADNTKAGKAAFKAVKKALCYLADNPRHASLHTHEFDSLEGSNGEKVFEAYAQNNTPGAWRIFFHYGPGPGVITLVAVTPHP